jgi:cellulose synthase/poly-beta-1,6-N-acetylglucosamine synthase-like glycosyltransferase
MRRRDAVWLFGLLFWHALRWPARGKQSETAPPVWHPGEHTPKVSFLVPAWNASTDIPHLISAYRTLTYPNRELILSAGGDDGSYELARRYAVGDVTVVEQVRGEGKQGGLRQAFARATGSIVYLTDVDCRPNDAVVNNLLGPLVDGDLQVVTGSSCPLPGEMNDSFIQTQWAVEQMTIPNQMMQTEGILGCNAALTRDAVLASGAFTTAAPSGTDYTLALQLLQAGYQIWFVPGHPMPTAYSPGLRFHIRRQARWIRNVFQLGRRYGVSAQVHPTLKTLALPYALLGTMLLGLWRPIFRTVSAGLILHALLNRLAYQHRARLPLRPVGAFKHLLVAQIAALRAGLDLVRGGTTW